jgi:hypothetical protein
MSKTHPKLNLTDMKRLDMQNNGRGYKALWVIACLMSV